MAEQKRMKTSNLGLLVPFTANFVMVTQRKIVSDEAIEFSYSAYKDGNF